MQILRILRHQVACLCLLLFLIPASVAAGECEAWVGRMQSQQGLVEVRRYASQDWQPAMLGQTYCLGDRIRVGDDARASIELNNDTIVRLDRRSTLVFPEPENDGLSFVELIEGALHLMSRIRGRLEIRTPFVNAGLEGTEFVVRVGPDQAQVLVIEGTVRVSNAFGSLRISDGQAASAMAGSAPVLRLDLKPADAVHWTLYYPTVLDPRSKPGNDQLAAAQRLLQVGRADEAKARIDDVLAQQPERAEAWSLDAIVALTQNDRDRARRSADRGIQTSVTPATLLAVSYVQQADFELAAALTTALDGVRRFPDLALLWARLAELQLMQEMYGEAASSAGKAVALDPELSRATTVRGFTGLANTNLDTARGEFTRAIEQDSSDPLPRLGLGLVEIRENRLAEGRRQIEIAVTLDPANALLRSYLGKAYAEEGREDGAATEFDLAKQLDPLDPTPWFHDGIRKRTNNEPIAAIRDFEQSIALNDNRAVYRSRLLLDDDLAVRTGNIGATYAELGLRDVARSHASRSLAANPGNAAAHELLAESYSGVPRRGITRMSERLQAQLLQPLTARPFAPSELIREQDPGTAVGRFATGVNEYSELFDHQGPRFFGGAYVGGNGSSGFELVHSNLLDNASYSVGYAKFDSHGFRSGTFDADGFARQYSSDINRESYNLFAQVVTSEQLSLQVEARHVGQQQGDLRLDPRGVAVTERRELDANLLRAGGRWRLNTSNDLIFSLAHAERDETVDFPGFAFNCPPFPFPSPFPCVPPERILVNERTFDERTGTLAELQLQHRGSDYQIVAGVSHRDIDAEYSGLSTVSTSIFNLVTANPIQGSDDIRSTSAYLYTHWPTSPDMLWTLGVGYDDHDEPLRGMPIEYSRVNPKLGLQWQIAPWLNLRSAHIATTKHQLIVEETIEPTQVAGFAQFYDDFNRSRSKMNAIAFDLKPDRDTFVLLEARNRKSHEIESSNSLDERTYRIQVSRIFDDNWTASIGFTRQHDDYQGPAESFDLLTTQVPISIGYNHPSGFLARANWTAFDQELKPPGAASVDTNFNAVSLSAGYRWNKGRSRFMFGIDDALDDVEVYLDDAYKTHDAFNVFRPFVPGRVFWASIDIALD
ncbi:MAG: TonB-dependent receptor [Gammaproteobacteria bacterium]|nr:TonB-dependent receptor [Gammaproteobacteria bacterium]